jgi:hypothetical protein
MPTVDLNWGLNKVVLVLVEAHDLIKWLLSANPVRGNIGSWAPVSAVALVRRAVPIDLLIVPLIADITREMAVCVAVTAASRTFTTPHAGVVEPLPCSAVTRRVFDCPDVVVPVPSGLRASSIHGRQEPAWVWTV